LKAQVEKNREIQEGKLKLEPKSPKNLIGVILQKSGHKKGKLQKGPFPRDGPEKTWKWKIPKKMELETVNGRNPKDWPTQY